MGRITDTTKLSPENLYAASIVAGGSHHMIEGLERQGSREMRMQDCSGGPILLPVAGLLRDHHQGLDPIGPIEQAVWDKMGIKVVEADSTDPIFCLAEVPAAWRIIGSAINAYWNYLVDTKGRKRAAIFYKATSYDRRAHITIERRFCIIGDVHNVREELDVHDLNEMPSFKTDRVGRCEVWDEGRRTVAYATPTFRHSELVETVEKIRQSGDGKMQLPKELAPLAASLDSGRSIKYLQNVDRLVNGLAEAWLEAHYPQWRECGAYWDEV